MRWKASREQQADIKYPTSTGSTLGEGHRDAREARRLAERRVASSAQRRCANTISAMRTVQPDAGRARRDAGPRRAHAMNEGALGVGSALIYVPGNFAEDRRAHRARQGGRAESGGAYISHMRSEGDRLLEGIDELDRASREAAGMHGEIYHLKAAGRDELAEDGARRSRTSKRRTRAVSTVSANMYTYTAGATGLNACMPPCGAGRRPRRVDRAAARIRRSRAHADQGDAHARQGLGEPAATRPASRRTCC